MAKHNKFQTLSYNKSSTMSTTSLSRVDNSPEWQLEGLCQELKKLEDIATKEEGFTDDESDGGSVEEAKTRAKVSPKNKPRPRKLDENIRVLSETTTRPKGSSLLGNISRNWHPSKEKIHTKLSQEQMKMLEESPAWKNWLGAVVAKWQANWGGEECEVIVLKEPKSKKKFTHRGNPKGTTRGRPKISEDIYGNPDPQYEADLEEMKQLGLKGCKLGKTIVSKRAEIRKQEQRAKNLLKK